MASNVTRDMAIKELARRELARRQQQQGMPEGDPRMARLEEAKARFAAGEAAPAVALSPEAAAIPAQVQVQARPYDGGALAASVNSGGQVLTAGFGDEISAGLFTPIEMGIQAYKGEPVSISGAYDNGLKRQRDQLHQDQELHPVATTVGAIGAGLAMPSVAAKTLPAMLAQGAAVGGATGFGMGEGGLENRLKSMGFGAAAGAGGALLAKGLGNVIAKKAAAKAIPTTEDLRSASTALYDQARAAQVAVKAPAIDRAINNLKVAAGRVNRDLRPKTAGVVDDFTAAMGKDISLDELDELRQVLNKSMLRAEPQDEMMLGRMKGVLDSFTDNLKAGDVVGDLKAFDYIKQARPLWAQKSKSEVLEALVEKAQNQATGFENGMRVQFRGLLGNPSRLKGFSKAEIDAMKKVVRGGPVENTLRAVGWLDPRKTLGASLSTLTGVGAGPVAGAAAAGAGYVAGKGAAAMTRGNVRNVENIVRSGGKSLSQIVKEGRAGQGIGALGAQKGRALDDMVRLPLSLTLASETTRRP